MHPAIYVAVVLAVLTVFGAIMRAAATAANPALQLSAIARALGMTIVEGDPDYHLSVGAKPNLLLTLFGVTKYQVKLRLAGSVGPHPLELAVEERVFRIRLRRITLKDDHHYAAHLRMTGVGSMAFEAWRPSEHDGPEPQQHYPIVYQGNSQWGPWFLATPQPVAGPQLAAMLQRMAECCHHFHVIGEGGVVTMPMTRLGMAINGGQLPILKDELIALGHQLGPAAVAGVQAPPNVTHAYAAAG